MRVMVSANGNRIGESHPKAMLSDAEVEQLLADRGPDDCPLKSYNQLAKKYKISKSAVADICKGRRRAIRGVIVERKESRRNGDKVVLQVRVSLKARHVIRKNGGGRWLDSVILGLGK